MLPAVISPLERDLHITDAQFGWVATAFMLGYFLTAPIFGWLGDRVPRRGLIIVGVIAWCVGTMLCGTAHGLIPLLCFRVLVGVGEASYGTLSPGWIADAYPAAKRNNAVSTFYLAIPVGSALGFVVGGALAAHFGWRAAFYLAGVPALLLAAALSRVSEPPRGGASATDAPSPPQATGRAGSAYRDLLSNRPYLLAVAGYVAQTFALGAFGVFAAAFLERQHHVPYAEADRFFGLALVVSGLLATLTGGAWGTAWQKRTPRGYALVLAISGVLAIPAVYAAFLAPGALEAKAALAAAMFLLFLPTGPLNTLILEAVPARQRASAMAASIFAIHFFGDLWSPALVGHLSDRWGDLRAAILWTLPPAIMVCAGFWVWLALRRGHLPTSDSA